VIGEALAGIDPESEYALAMQAARQRVGREPPADPDARRRLGLALRRRGFSWETIERVCASLARESENDEE
jgi:SOS response regulatory protein OraA/RecX